MADRLDKLGELFRSVDLSGRGAISLALIITNEAKGRAFPLQIDEFLNSQGTRVRGLTGARVKTILGAYGIEEVFTAEGGRTSPLSVTRAVAYIEWLNTQHAAGNLNLDEIEGYLAQRASDLIDSDAARDIPHIPEQEVAPAQYEWNEGRLQVKRQDGLVDASKREFSDAIVPLREELDGLIEGLRGSNQHRTIYDAVLGLRKQFDGGSDAIAERDFAIGYAGIRLFEIVAQYERSDDDEYTLDPASLGRLKALLAYYRLLERRLPRWMKFKSAYDDILELVGDVDQLDPAISSLEEIEAELRKHPEVVAESTPESIHGVLAQIRYGAETSRAALRAALATVGNLTIAIASFVAKWVTKQAGKIASNLTVAILSGVALKYVLPHLAELVQAYPSQLFWMKPILEFLKVHLG